MVEIQVVEDVIGDLYVLLFQNEVVCQVFENLVNKDGLIGLINCWYFMLLVDVELQCVQCYWCLVSVGMVDFDFFKKFNDIYGYVGGDVVFCVVVVLMYDMLCQLDLVGCYGGEEFVFIFLESMLVEVVSFVECICVCCVDYDIWLVDGWLVWVILSIGLVDVSECLIEIVFKYVDDVFYQVKYQGCNWVVVVGGGVLVDLLLGVQN